jgi:hypothetical protein
MSDLKTFYDIKQDSFPVHEAIAFNRLYIIQYLLDLCTDKTKTAIIFNAFDKKGLTPLMYAIQLCNLDICTVLCSINCVKESLNSLPDKYGSLPLHIALKKKQWDICDLLIDYGAKIDTMVGLGSGIGETVLHVAMRDRDLETVQYIAKCKSGLLMKKNQQEEIALFTCLVDNRRVRHKNATTFLDDIWPHYAKLFHDYHEKALVQKNAHGHNLLTGALIKLDLVAVRSILKYLDSLNKHKLTSTLILDIDVRGNNIFHIGAQGAYSLGMSFNEATDEPSEQWLEPLILIIDFVESQEFKLDKIAPSLLGVSKCLEIDQQEDERPVILLETITETLDKIHQLWSQGKRKTQKVDRKRPTSKMDFVFKFLGVDIA